MRPDAPRQFDSTRKTGGEWSTTADGQRVESSPRSHNAPRWRQQHFRLSSAEANNRHAVAIDIRLFEQAKQSSPGLIDAVERHAARGVNRKDEQGPVLSRELFVSQIVRRKITTAIDH